MHIVLELTDSWARGWVRYSNDLGDGPPTPPAFTTSACISFHESGYTAHYSRH